MRHKNALWFGGILAVPDGQAAILMTTQELFALVIPSDGSQCLKSLNSSELGKLRQE